MEPIQAELASPEPVEPRPPKLSIFHLLCWTAGTAIVLNCYRAYPQHAEPTRLALGQMYMTASSIANGLALASLLLFAKYSFSRPCVFPRHAGHWFLINGGLQCLFGWPAYFLALRWFQLHPLRDSMPIELRAQIIQSTVGNVIGCTLAVVALQSIVEPRWRTMWYLWFVLGLIELALGAGMFFAEPYVAYLLYRFWLTAYAAVSALYVFLLVSAAVRDRRVPRDWLHFAGVGVAVVFFASGPIYYLLDALFVREP